jgi:trehalose-6-phosphate synthase
MWSRESLAELVKEKLSEYFFIVVSNREPYIHSFAGGKAEVNAPTGGLTVALDPVMQACGGTWIAHGSGEADREVVDDDNKIRVPPSNASYTLRRVWLTREEEEDYYTGFSNEALWPLCHIVYTRPIFEERHWNTYKQVNRKFADNVLDEAGGKKAFVFIQDYHLAILSRMVRQQNPDIVTAQFWHIPWPNSEAFRICPWQEDILRGMLSNDLMGFHIRYDCNNFLDTVEGSIEARVDWVNREIMADGRTTRVADFPISVDYEQISKDAKGEAVEREIERLRGKFGIDDEFIGIGMDRIDYTKGIPDRLMAIDLFLDKYRAYHRKLVFIQAGVPSRIKIPSYISLQEEIDNLIQEINWKYAIGTWKPVIMVENMPQLTLMALRRMAHFCIVNSLHDGMNLVAKEFVASRFDEDGILILSPFTGASRELTDALIVNPFATERFADTIKLAIEMPAAERKQRMRRMREVVKENNIYKWAADIITEISGLRGRH